MIEINTGGYIAIAAVIVGISIGIRDAFGKPINGQKFSIWLLWDFSGLRWVWEKISPPAEVPNGIKPPSTFLFWASGAFGLYIALFGLASQRYENRVDLIETRVNGIYAQLATENYKKALSRIPRVQSMKVPAKPVLLEPSTVFYSLFVEQLNMDTIAQMKEIVEDWKESLEEVDLESADLMEAKLWKASLSGSNLFKAKFLHANLSEAHLERANLGKANIEGAYLEKAILSEAILSGANLFKANFERANLQRAILSEANLLESNFFKANLERSTLRNANLKGANFQGTILRKANFFEAILKEALFIKSDLQAAYAITAEQLCTTKSLWMTKLDEYLKAEIEKQCPHLLEKPDWLKD